ncbi:MAG: hypothetical protein ABJ205_15490 [Erythrobacter sp.]|uniref:hypothetical protein n=1 Tax=Erythrobacter sp. TaxID=1042 RepID=UPI003265D99C
MAKPKIKLRCETRSDFTDPAIALALLSCLEAQSSLTPDKVSHSEPIDQPYGGVEKFIQDWWGKPAKMLLQSGQGGSIEFLQSVMLKRSKRPAYWAKIEFRDPNDPRHGVPGSIMLESIWEPKIDYMVVLKDWCEALNASFGSLHIFADEEVNGYHRLLESLPTEDEKDELYRGINFFRAGLFESPLNGAIPNLGWATFISDEKLQNISFHDCGQLEGRVEKVRHGKIFCVSHEISSTIDDFSTFSRQRHALKSCFPADFFMIKDEPILS